MFLNEQQRAVLTALCDTLVPSLVRQPDTLGFWARKASDFGVPNVMELLWAAAPEHAQAQLAGLLDLLGAPAVAATWGGPERGFLELDTAERAALLNAWKDSPAAELRAAFRALVPPLLAVYYGFATADVDNPNWAALGYPGPLRAPPAIARPIQPLVVEDGAVLDCDVVVVGSGAGGGVVAGELTAAGQSVVVLEKGLYVAEDQMTQREMEMAPLVYEGGLAITTRTGGIAIAAGSCLGGGTVVNWSGALRTPGFVLEEWATEHGLGYVLDAEYDKSFEAVERATSVGTAESFVNGPGRALLEACRALGWEAEVYPRNVRGCDPRHCGYCVFGCQKGAKQSTVKAYLEPAFRAGLRILVGTLVRRVIVEQGAARGVEAVQIGADGVPRRLTVRARRVVVAAGSLHTPALLRRSGLDHAQIGRNLHIHPGAGVGALYPDARPAWEGAMMSAACNQFVHADGNWGPKIVNVPLHPVWLSLLEWSSGEDHKELMAQARHAVTFAVYTRDRDGGRIDVDEDGNPVVDYWPSEYDTRNILRGVVEAARLHVAAGATRLFLPNGARYDAAAGGAALDELAQEILRWPLLEHRNAHFTMHQMSSCRMGGDATLSPLTPEAETREVRDLFVADASVLPTATSANPMLSIQAMAHHTTRGIIARS
jgi:choline dehydrogenase-like flavoprotein